MSSEAINRYETRQSRSRENSPANEQHGEQQQQPPTTEQPPQPQDDDHDEHTRFIIKKYKLEDIVPRAGDYDTARAGMMPLDGSTPIFAGGRPIHTRRESSSPAVVEALHRGFKLAHFPAKHLLPDDMFSKHGAKEHEKRNPHSNSPDPYAPPQSSRGASQQSAQQYPPSPSVSAGRGASQRIPGNISPHVLPQGALLQPLPPARELLETKIPLAEPPRYRDQLVVHQAAMDVGSWALSDPEMITNMARHFRRCFPRTERDDIHDDFPTSRYSGNYILRRYGGAFPEHCQYNFYRKYSEFGLNAATSEFHNFPAGRHPCGPI